MALNYFISAIKTQVENLSYLGDYIRSYLTKTLYASYKYCIDTLTNFIDKVTNIYGSCFNGISTEELKRMALLIIKLKLLLEFVINLYNATTQSNKGSSDLGSGNNDFAAKAVNQMKIASAVSEADLDYTIRSFNEFYTSLMQLLALITMEINNHRSQSVSTAANAAPAGFTPGYNARANNANDANDVNGAKHNNAADIEQKISDLIAEISIADDRSAIVAEVAGASLSNFNRNTAKP